MKNVRKVKILVETFGAGYFSVNTQIKILELKNAIKYQLSSDFAVISKNFDTEKIFLSK